MIARALALVEAQAAGRSTSTTRWAPAASASARSITKTSSRKAIPISSRCRPRDEWDAIALNYTSGTTGDPKGVVYHHRGAYLNALGNVLVWTMPRAPVYLWTLPMFHCNGWCFPWTLAAHGRHQCLPAPRRAPGDLRRDRATTASRHFCGAPIVLNMLVNAPAEERKASTARSR